MKRKASLFLLLLLVLFSIGNTIPFDRSNEHISIVKCSSQIGIYWDENYSDPVTQVKWGTVYPGSLRSISVFFKNEGTEEISLSVSTGNWTPSHAKDFMNVSLSTDAQILPNETVQSSFVLKVFENITDIVDFAFDIYVQGETISSKGTDPNPIGWELLDDNKILRLWNKLDSYYFNVSSGIQFSNHYLEWWSYNVFGIGYYAAGEWNLLHWTDSLSGFNRDIETDWESYVNATLWKDLSSTIGGTTYDYRLAIRYHLKTNDSELTVQPYIKNIGTEDINADIGFAWRIRDIQVSDDIFNDKLYLAWLLDEYTTTGESYFLNQTLDKFYKNSSHPFLWGYQIRDTVTKQVLETWWTSQILSRYLLKVESLAGQYNAPVTLYINAGPLLVGQEKSTVFLWHDADLLDSYSEANQDGNRQLQDYHPSASGYMSASGQTWTSPASEAYKITSCKFYLWRSASSPSGESHAVLYDESGGTPTGDPLGTSDGFEVSDLTTTAALITFTFTGDEQYEMDTSTTYALAFQNPASGDISTAKKVFFGVDTSSPTHGGQNFYYTSSGWSGDASRDSCFYVYGEAVGAGNEYTRTATLSLTTAWSRSRTWTLTRVFSQSLSWTSNLYRTWDLSRYVSLSLSLSTSVSRTWTLTRAVTQSLTFVWDAWATLTEAAQYTRIASLTLTFVWNLARTWSLSRSISQALTFTWNTWISLSTGVQQFTRTATLALTFALNLDRTIQILRNLTLNLSFGWEAIGPPTEITRTITLALNFIFNAGGTLTEYVAPTIRDPLVYIGIVALVIAICALILVPEGSSE